MPGDMKESLDCNMKFSHFYAALNFTFANFYHLDGKHNVNYLSIVTYC